MKTAIYIFRRLVPYGVTRATLVLAALMWALAYTHVL
jgi:hypothetical protein